VAGRVSSTGEVIFPNFRPITKETHRIMATKEKENGMHVAPFGVEMDAGNKDVMLRSIQGQRVRSRINPTRTIKDSKTGMEMIIADEARVLAAYGEIPGQQVHVDPAKMTYVIYDPLTEKKHESTCDRIVAAMTRNGFFNVKKITGVPAQEGNFLHPKDPSRMRTLVRELLWLLDSGEARMVKGPKPDMDDIEAMPGKFILNAGEITPSHQPRYEEDYEAWLSKLTSSGVL